MSDVHTYLQIRDAARYLGVSTATLRNWDRAGKIQAYRHPVNNYRLFSCDDLRSILRQIEQSQSKAVPAGAPSGQEHQTRDEEIRQ